MPNDTTVHVIDDDSAMRQSLAFLLRSANIVSRTYENAESFFDALPNIEPGCIVTDVRMPGLSGIDLLRKLRENGMNMPVIVITGHGDVPLAVEAMKCGAADFIEKPFDDEVLLNAIHSALRHRNDTVMQDAAIAAIQERLASLSLRERQVLEGLVGGHQNKTIAFDLGISPRTVEIYRANVMTKMEAGSLSELVRKAIVGGILSVTAGATESLK